MCTTREIRETAARCVEVLEVYFNSDRTQPLARVLMVAQIETIASHAVQHLKIPKKRYFSVKDLVELDLTMRYGPELGKWLFKEFDRAFMDGANRFDGQGHFRPADLIEPREIPRPLATKGPPTPIHETKAATNDLPDHSPSRVLMTASQSRNRERPRQASFERKAVMSTDRTVEETISQCISCMVFYQNCRSGSLATTYKNVMIEDIHSIALTVAKWGLDGQTDALIMQPVRDHLIARYGASAGRQLFGEFAAAFSIKAE